MLLGPFGFGITAYEFISQNGGDLARVSAIEEFHRRGRQPIYKELVAALGDKDLTVRAAAAKRWPTITIARPKWQCMRCWRTRRFRATDGSGGVSADYGRAGPSGMGSGGPLQQSAGEALTTPSH